MADHSDALVYIGELRTSRMLATSVHECFAELGCGSYVKTIYVGYTVNGEMVAAMYGHADHIEVALALPEEMTDPLLEDASHLTWRTLPVAAIVRSPTDMDRFRLLADEACARVQLAQHDVVRDNDFFIRAKRSRMHDRNC